MVGPSPRISFESRSIISSDAFTYCAISIWEGITNLYMRDYGFRMSITLLITSKSDCDIPGPPFLGILSPPYRSLGLGGNLNEEFTHRDVNHVDNIVCKFSRVVCGKIITSALNE